MFSSDKKRDTAISVAGAVASAIYLFPYKWAGAFANAYVLAFALLLSAALLNTAVLLWTQPKALLKRPKVSSLTWRVSGLLALLTLTGNISGAQAVQQLEPAIASVLLRTEIVFVGGFAALLLGSRPERAWLWGALTALLGLTLMRWPLTWSGTTSGVLWALAAAASFALMQVVTRRTIQRISPLLVNSLRLWFAVFLFSLQPGLVATAFSCGWEFWVLISSAAAFGPVLGRLLIMYSLRSLSAAHSALLLLLSPVFAFALGYALLGTSPTRLEVLGGVVMLLGIALPSWAALRTPTSST